MRHEVLSLQNAMTTGSAEFFINCVQVTVGGDGTGVPTAEETVKFPGAYNAEDKGIHFNAYDGSTEAYVFPGPPVAALAAAAAKSSSKHSARMQRMRRH